MIRSMDCGSISAASIARCEAISARSLVVTPGCEVARMDARAGNDPFVARLNAFSGETFSQILIGDASGRQVAAGAEHAGINCRLSHYAFEDCAA